jgi:hypothetical protein
MNTVLIGMKVGSRGLIETGEANFGKFPIKYNDEFEFLRSLSAELERFRVRENFLSALYCTVNPIHTKN